jgi:large subunit ribosomal protein L22
MEFRAVAKYVRYSPYKLRPLADIIRGKNAQYAINWLTTYPAKRMLPIKCVLASACANAKSLQNLTPAELLVKEIRIDQGPIFRYFKPGAMGRANIQRKRLSHIQVIVEKLS